MPAGGSYRFHDLVRAHAAERGAEDPGWPQAYGRLARWAVALTAHALAAAFRHRPPPAEAARALAEVPEPLRVAVGADPTGWVADRWPVLEQLLRAALAAADLGTATALVANSADLLQRADLLDECVRAATELARAGAGDPAARATAAGAEAGVWAQRGRHPRVAELAERMVAEGDAIDDELLLDGLATLGAARMMCGETAAALAAQTAAVELARRIGDRRGEYSATFTLAEIHRTATGDLTAALAHTTRALELADAGDDVKDQAMARFSAARVRLARGEAGSAAALAAVALRACRDTGDRVGEAWCLLLSADAATAGADPAAAVELAGRAVTLAHRLSRPDAQAGGEVALARALAALGDLPGALGRGRAGSPAARRVRRPGGAPHAGGAGRRARRTAGARGLTAHPRPARSRGRRHGNGRGGPLRSIADRWPIDSRVGHDPPVPAKTRRHHEFDRHRGTADRPGDRPGRCGRLRRRLPVLLQPGSPALPAELRRQQVPVHQQPDLRRWVPVPAGAVTPPGTRTVAPRAAAAVTAGHGGGTGPC